MPFWIPDYIQMLEMLRSEGMRPRTVADFFRHPGDREVILRHDVDRRPGMAIQMAEAETSLGIRSTFYFRCNKHGGFSVAACCRIAELGHEIGYHYEDLARSAGDRNKALDSFGRNLSSLRRLARCDTISMHGSPLSRHDNRRLLCQGDLPHYKLLGDASTSMEPFQLLYFTDAGGDWNNQNVNFRDQLGQMPKGINPLHWLDLETTLHRYPKRTICFNLHPERWVVNRTQYCVSAVADQCVTRAKAILRIVRR